MVNRATAGPKEGKQLSGEAHVSRIQSVVSPFWQKSRLPGKVKPWHLRLKSAMPLRLFRDQKNGPGCRGDAIIVLTTACVIEERYPI